MIKAVIFDMDGVIADSHSIINKLFTDTLNKELKLNISKQEFSKFPGMRFEQRMEEINKERKLGISKKDIDNAIEKGRLEYFTNSVSYVVPYPGLKELLETLKKANIKMCIGSNGSRSSISKLIKQFDIEKYFSSIVTYDDVAHGKPAPDMFLKNAENLKLNPEECIVIEDSIEGITAAKSAGMKVIAISTTLSTDLLKEADLILDTIKDISIQQIHELR